MEKKSALATKIGESGTFLTLTAAAVVLSSLVVFALVIWAVLG
jgi:hypothetical protein